MAAPDINSDATIQSSFAGSGSAHVDAQFSRKPKKSAVRLHHLVLLAHALAIELTSNKATGDLYRSNSLFTSAVEFEEKGSATTAYVGIRGAKTARPGETQRLKMQDIPIMLCPIKALKRRITEAKGAKTSLFGYFDRSGVYHHLTEQATCRALTAIWTAHGFSDLSGHSFRVGGASFCYAMETPTYRIEELGRWTSDCYKLYSREYRAEDKLAVIDLWSELETYWTDA
ncbi:hypothetical protein MJO28_001777 [Puccinia striiformis f. sp. tritici]|uniref:Tyr recombinase domain-containing protein n=2 Tax=Puccinia striiformis f. sp. tritici TaxID=168172 RepID=A0A0L0W4L9_9BASI|nr:hypothetical protein MJO28_001777 [Puccinia striiformis f. sp. tritici]KAI7966071.1 hypothetical protein MJO29_001819 [Puccinia striiformis f. sp. tritici]KNF06402.1 hypothetical protein PSTG_00285 [Puccinia striiformis f. sp. tritici PST-78]